jgi:signal transduction histidine kinase
LIWTDFPWRIRRFFFASESLSHEDPLAPPNPRTRHQAFMREYGLVSFLGIPLMAKDEALGVLAVFTKETHRFDEEEVRFLTTLGGQAAVAIHNAQIYEEMVGANKVKEEFLSVMSHELRTPLSVVMGYAGMLKEGILGEVSPRQQEALQKILSRAADQLHMINSIMQTTQLETRAVMPEYHSVNVSELLDHLRSDLDMTHNKKSVALVWDYASEPVHVVTDSPKVKQILQNLIGNALKFTDHGSVTVSVRLAENTGAEPLDGASQLIQDSNLTPFGRRPLGAAVAKLPADQGGGYRHRHVRRAAMVHLREIFSSGQLGDPALRRRRPRTLHR